MAGTLTVTMSNPYAQGGPNTITLDWIATSGGAVSAAIASTYAAAQLATYQYATPRPSKIIGKLVRAVVAPGTNGAGAALTPTAGYDITLLNPYSGDVAGGNLLDRSATLPESWVPDEPIAIDCDLTFTVANAGDSKRGRVVLYFE
ncbi:MAG: hypothetical protein WC455_17425 [Dehalococcoidia bacterium]|jgi:hypothetical protein